MKTRDSNTRLIPKKKTTKEFISLYESTGGLFSDAELAALSPVIPGTTIFDVRDVLPKVIVSYSLQSDQVKYYYWKSRYNIDKVIVHQTHSNAPVMNQFRYFTGQTHFSSDKKVYVENIPYHFIIGKDGQIFWLNSIHKKTFHTRGYNERGISISLIGKFSSDPLVNTTADSTENEFTVIASRVSNGKAYFTNSGKEVELPTLQQIQSLRMLINYLIEKPELFTEKDLSKSIKLFVTQEAIVPHSAYKKSSCPGQVLENFVQDIREKTLDVSSPISYVIRDGDVFNMLMGKVNTIIDPYGVYAGLDVLTYAAGEEYSPIEPDYYEFIKQFYGIPIEELEADEFI